MSVDKGRRKEQRKFKRVEVRYGPEAPQHRAIAVQISSTGAFISANRPIFAPGSPIVIEFRTPDGPVQVRAVVRHAKNLPPELARFARPGMGVELISPPEKLLRFLASL